MGDIWSTEWADNQATGNVSVYVGYSLKLPDWIFNRKYSSELSIIMDVKEAGCFSCPEISEYSFK